MKFFSLFTKTPTHQRFTYTPRYYDAKKEEMREREIRVRKELQMEQQKEGEPDVYRSRIAGSFRAARIRSKAPGGVNSSLLRFGILLFLTLFLIAYLTWGSVAVYGFFVFIPLYLYLKFRKN